MKFGLNKNSIFRSIIIILLEGHVKQGNQNSGQNSFHFGFFFIFKNPMVLKKN